MGLIHVSNWHGDTHGRSLGMLAPSTPADPLGAGNTALVQALTTAGFTPITFHDIRQNRTVATGVSSLLDVKGDGTYGPALVQATTTKQPAWDGTTANFDGVDDFLLSASALAALDLSIDPCAYTDVLIADVPNALFRIAGAIGAAGGGAPRWLQEVRTGPVWQGITDLSTATGSATLPTPGAIHVFISTFSYTTNPSKALTLNTQVPPGATSTNAGHASGPEAAGANLISVGADSAGQNACALRFRARLILPGLITAPALATIDTWANTFHSAIVT